METSRGMNGVKHKILVLSGKGGVGKSTVACQLAQALVRAGQKVGLLDIDLCGPSIPRLVGLQGKDVKKSSYGWLPVFVEAGEQQQQQQQLGVMSIGFLLPDPDAAVVWRGPKKNAMVKQFIEDVAWGELDYLVVDTPPGTSDEHLAIVEALREYSPDGAVLVTTPQQVALIDVRKEISFCRKLHVPILGLLENMSGFVCPHCAGCTNIFSSQGGVRLAEELKLPFLGRIPIDPRIGECADTGANFAERFPESPAIAPITAFVERLVQRPQQEPQEEQETQEQQQLKPQDQQQQQQQNGQRTPAADGDRGQSAAAATNMDTSGSPT